MLAAVGPAHEIVLAPRRPPYNFSSAATSSSYRDRCLPTLPSGPPKFVEQAEHQAAKSEQSERSNEDAEEDHQAHFAHTHCSLADSPLANARSSSALADDASHQRTNGHEAPGIRHEQARRHSGSQRDVSRHASDAEVSERDP